GKLTGGSNLGRFCEKCQSVVRTIEADLRRPGFIDISPYHILTFHGYNAFSKIFKNLDQIVSTTKQITRSGKIKDDGLPTIMDLYDDYEDLYQSRIGLDKDIVFTTKIPVYSSRMRPLISNNTTITLLEINQLLLSLVKLSNIISSAVIIPNFRREIEVQKTLNEIQQNFNRVCKIVVDQCNTKAGVFRRTMASGRLDNSSRMVIVLGLGLRSYEVDMPYQTMMCQYEEEIANYLVKQEGVKMATAISMIKENARVPHPKFVNIINTLLRTGTGLWVLVNRNPTISKSGILYMRIRKIHDDPKDYTLHLPQDILALLAADFDGDWHLTVLVLSYRNVGCRTD
ncbi:MAG: hypothetical protein K2F99_04945, partial [Muribaculaceae bacterium]|nr:hypothetical protein [Muribaculaceae bacterium]